MGTGKNRSMRNMGIVMKISVCILKMKVFFIEALNIFTFEHDVNSPFKNFEKLSTTKQRSTDYPSCETGHLIGTVS
jgi:hypothetical protein